MQTLVLVILVGIALGLGSAAEAKVVNKTVTYQHEDVVLEGYLAWDDAVTGPRPGVLVIHQWMGLSDNERMRADIFDVAQWGLKVPGGAPPEPR